MNSPIFYGQAGFSAELGFAYVKNGNIPHGFIKLTAADRTEYSRLCEQLAESAPGWWSLTGFITQRGVNATGVEGDGGGRLLVDCLACHGEIAAAAFELSQSGAGPSEACWLQAEQELLSPLVAREPRILVWPVQPFQPTVEPVQWRRAA